MFLVEFLISRQSEWETNFPSKTMIFLNEFRCSIFFNVFANPENSHCFQEPFAETFN